MYQSNDRWYEESGRISPHEKQYEDDGPDEQGMYALA